MRTDRRKIATGRLLGLGLLLVLCVSVEAFAGGSPPPTVTRDAYLQQLGANSVLIRFRTSSTASTTPIVEFGTSPDVFNQTATGSSEIPPSGGGDRQFTVPLVGLTPQTTYYYRYGTASDGILGGGEPTHRFTTAASVGSTEPLSIWIVGDSGTGLPEQRAVLDSVVSRLDGASLDLILHAGDLAYDYGSDQEFTDNFFAPYAEILRQVPLWPTFGNHDADSATSLSESGPYYEAFELPRAGELGGAPSGTEAYYSFDLHNVHFIVIDTADTDFATSTTMIDWITADLASHLSDWVVALFHHPPYSKGSHDSDDGFDSGGRLVLARELLVPALEAGGVDLILSGHSHGYERSFLIDGVWGDGAAPHFPTPPQATLLTEGRVLDNGDGLPQGDGAYQKTGSAGQVSVVAGHGGRSVGGVGGHPVIAAESFEFGSCLLRIEGDLLWLENLRVDGVATDRFVISKGTAPFTATVTVEGSGTVERAPLRPLYQSGETVELRAIAAPGWRFDGWAGSLSSFDELEMLTVTTNEAVTARFVPEDSDRIYSAYNDLAWVPGQADDSITMITSPNGGSGLPSTGMLIDRATGAPVGASLTVFGGLYDGGAHGLGESGAPLPETDADLAFRDHLNAHGSIGPLDLAAPAGDLLLIFTGLDPGQRFELVLYGNRNDEGWETATEVELLDAVSFTNESSSAQDNPDPISGGALFSGESDPQTRLPSENPLGYVARFTDVDPGADGMVTIRLRADGTDLSSNGGKYANAVALLAREGPTPFLRGDVNFSGLINLPDAIRILAFLFSANIIEEVESCPAVADFDDSGAIDLSDAVAILGFLFANGAPPATPWPSCEPFEAVLSCTDQACP